MYIEEDADHDMRPADELPSLTPLRGIAALWVVFYHYAVWYFPRLHPEHYTHLVDKGYLAVDMFFMLSGFVLTHVYSRSFTEGTGDVSGRYRQFMVARVARLYPLHLFMLALFIATAVATRGYRYVATGDFDPIPLEGARSFAALVANLFMLQGLKASELAWNYPAWSISIEFIAYLGFPVALPWMWRAPPRIKAVLIVALVSAMALLAFLTRDNFNQWDGPITLLRCLPEFMLGTVLYAALREPSGASLLGRDVFAVSIIAGVMVLLHLGAPDLLVVLCFPVLMLATVQNTGYVAAILDATPLRWLGNISYSLYLLHGFIQFLATKLLAVAGISHRSELSESSSAVIMTVMVATSLIAATITYRAIETNGRRRLRELLGVGPKQGLSHPATSAAQTHSRSAEMGGMSG